MRWRAGSLSSLFFASTFEALGADLLWPVHTATSRAPLLEAVQRPPRGPRPVPASDMIGGRCGSTPLGAGRRQPPHYDDGKGGGGEGRGGLGGGGERGAHRSSRRPVPRSLTLATRCFSSSPAHAPVAARSETWRARYAGRPPGTWSPCLHRARARHAGAPRRFPCTTCLRADAVRARGDDADQALQCPPLTPGSPMPWPPRPSPRTHRVYGAHGARFACAVQRVQSSACRRTNDGASQLPCVVCGAQVRSQCERCEHAGKRSVQPAIFGYHAHN